MLIPDGLRGLVWRIHDAFFVGRRLDLVVAESPLIAVAARDTEGRSRRPDAGSRQRAVVDGPLQGDIGTAVRSEIADRRETGIKGALREDGRADRLVHGPPGHRLDDRVRSELARNVRVRIDQARHYGAPRKVDDLSACRRHESGLDADDAVTGHEDRNSVLNRRRQAIDEPPGVDDMVGRRRLLLYT